MRDHDYWVYIVANRHNTTLYIGMTNDLQRRIAEHKRGEIKGFTQRYHLTRLVWFEHFRHVDDAIACEKKLKGWLRSKKNALIEKMNSRWFDLAANWHIQERRIDDGWSAALGEPELTRGSSLRSE